MKRSDILNQFIEASIAFQAADHGLRVKKYSGIRKVRKQMGESDSPVVIRGSVKSAKAVDTDEKERLEKIRDAWAGTYAALEPRKIKRVKRDISEVEDYTEKYTRRLDKATKGDKRRKNALRVAALTDLHTLLQDEHDRATSAATQSTVAMTGGVVGTV